jgi:hypothetical protein
VTAASGTWTPATTRTEPSATGATLEIIPWPIAAAVLVLTTAYVAELRVLARRERAAAKPRQLRASQPVRVGRAAAPSERRSTSTAAAPSTPGATIAEDHAHSSAAGGWNPVPVPLPTYVTAPKAVRAARTIELGGDGAWTSGRLPREEPVLRRPTAVSDPEPATAPGAEPGQPPRAVND